MTYLLPRSRRNQVFAILETKGLGPFLPKFKWTTEGSNMVDGDTSRIGIQDGKDAYYFWFDGEGNEWELTYYPGKALAHIEQESATWAATEAALQIWATALAAELLTPDYWESPADIAARLFGSNYSARASDNKFSSTEIEDIRGSIREYRRQLSAAYVLTEEQKADIDRRLAYLVREAETETRRAWYHTAVGVVVSIAAAIRPEAAVLAGALALFGSLLSRRPRPLLEQKKNSDRRLRGRD